MKNTLIRILGVSSILDNFAERFAAIAKRELASEWVEQTLTPLDQRVHRLEALLAEYPSTYLEQFFSTTWTSHDQTVSRLEAEIGHLREAIASLEKSMSEALEQDTTASDIRTLREQNGDLTGMLESLRGKIGEAQARLNQLEASVDEQNARLEEQSAATDRTLTDVEYAALQAEHHQAIDDYPREDLEKIIQPLLDCGDITDIGCGSGDFLALLATRRVDLDLTGVDTSPEAASVGQNNGLNIVLGDGLNYLADVGSDSLGAVSLRHIVEHLDGRYLRLLLENTFRALRPGGKVLIETPNAQSMYVMSRYYYIDPTHLMPRHPSLYVFLLQCIGFTNISLAYVGNTSSAIGSDTISEAGLKADLAALLYSGGDNVVIVGEK